MAYSAIDIGSPAVTRTYRQHNGTYVDPHNVANASGVLTSFTTFACYNGTMKVATFTQTSGSTFNCVDVETLSVTAGGSQTFTGKNCTVNAGDWLGWYGSATGGGVWQTNDPVDSAPAYYVQSNIDKCVVGSQTFSSSFRGLFWSVNASGVTIPDAPTGVSATDNLSDKVTITWTAGTGETDGHRVYRDGVDVSGVVAHGTATYDDVPGAGTYAYTVKAINAAGLSAASTADNGTRTEGGGPTPAIKVGGVWKETTSQKIKVGGAWKAISNIKVKVSGVWKSAT